MFWMSMVETRHPGFFDYDNEVEARLAPEAAQDVTIRWIFDHALGSLIAALVWSRRPGAAR